MIKSYVKRSSKMTKGQRRSLEYHSDSLLLNSNVLFDNSSVFTSNNPLVCEIGFGMGDSIVNMALNYHQLNFLGIDVYLPGVAKLISSCVESGLRNVKIYNDDCINILTNVLSDDSIDRFHIFYPDPWHKKRHNKRRLINKDFLILLHSKLKAEGLCHIVTDWYDYSVWIERAVLDCNKFNILPASDKLSLLNSTTKYQRRGQLLGHKNYHYFLKPIV